VKRYRKLVDAVEDVRLKEAVAKGYHKLLAYKDEYEVARLLLTSQEKAAAEFDGEFRMTYHLAPPILGGTGPDGRPKKRTFGPWMRTPLKVLAALRSLRGTPFDLFGYSAERRMERALIKQFEADMNAVLPKVTPETVDIAVALASLPLDIRGFGPVKTANEAKAAKRREELLAAFRQGGPDLAKAAE
jgi:indolepyruvate ferredoxin oxidoreductase